MPNDQPLRENADSLQMALRAAHMVAWEFDVATGSMEYSPDIDTLVQLNLNDRTLAAALVEHALRRTGHYVAESRIVKPDGNAVWIRSQGEVIRDTEGRPSRVIGVALDITERKEMDDLLRNIAAGVSVATGDAFFRSLVQHLCLSLKTDFACIGELSNRNQGTVRTIAMFAGNEFSEGLEYELAGTPCHEAVESGRCSYPRNVQSFFPQDRLLVDAGIESYLGVVLASSTGEPLGVMSVMCRTPLANVENAETILNIFASRASAELERRRRERASHESEIRKRAILGALPDIMFVLDGRGVIQDCYAKDYGELRLPEPASGKKLEAVLPAEVAHLILQSSVKLKPGDPAVVEYSLPVGGEMRFHEARTVSLGDGNLLIIIRDTTNRKRAEAELEESQRFARRIAETTPNVLFVYDLIEGRNIYSNERSMDVIGYTPKEIEDMGANFIPRLMHPDDLTLLSNLRKEYENRQDGEVFEHVFRMKHRNGQWRWVHRTATIFNRTADGQPRQILGAVTDITALKRNELELQELSARLLSIQDEERRRIARELHDSTGQNLTAIALNLGTLERAIDSSVRNTLFECQRLCRESQEEIRTLSYLLHPPMLDRFGLVGALDWYVEGFVKRTGIKVALDVRLGTDRLAPEMETDLFRVIQEGLTNIMRHSGSEKANIRLEKNEAQLILHIEDSGHGLSGKVGQEEPGQEAVFGVGIPGMRERLRQYGGSLEVRSEGQGTILTAVVPLSSPRPSTKTVEKTRTKTMKFR